MNKDRLVTADNDTEMFPIVDEEGNTIGKVLRADAHTPSLEIEGFGRKVLHPVVHLHVFNNKGELYLQHRADWKKVQPGKWDTATGGHIDFGETVETSLEREVYEEIGLEKSIYSPTLIKKYVYESEIERELVYVFKTILDDDHLTCLSPSPTETQGGRFWSMDEIRENIGKEVFTPMFEQEFFQIEN